MNPLTSHNSTHWLTVCMGCNKARNKQGAWEQVDLTKFAKIKLEISHGICPDCGPKLFPNFWRSESEHQIL